MIFSILTFYTQRCSCVRNDIKFASQGSEKQPKLLQKCQMTIQYVICFRLFYRQWFCLSLNVPLQPCLNTFITNHKFVIINFTNLDKSEIERTEAFLQCRAVISVVDVPLTSVPCRLIGPYLDSEVSLQNQNFSVYGRFFRSSLRISFSANSFFSDVSSSEKSCF